MSNLPLDTSFLTNENIDLALQGKHPLLVKDALRDPVMSQLRLLQKLSNEIDRIISIGERHKSYQQGYWAMKEELQQLKSMMTSIKEPCKIIIKPRDP